MTTTRIGRHAVKITRNDDDDNYDEDYASTRYYGKKRPCLGKGLRETTTTSTRTARDAKLRDKHDNDDEDETSEEEGNFGGSELRRRHFERGHVIRAREKTNCSICVSRSFSTGIYPCGIMDRDEETKSDGHRIRRAQILRTREKSVQNLVPELSEGVRLRGIRWSRITLQALERVDAAGLRAVSGQLVQCEPRRSRCLYALKGIVVL
ncbi:unnamed protein product [Trichogramma brassicae]|uniref:Uncharacterized protein n=1 Tax=Trichogramma brassicae TaxID=86971 RepID=A0A6H5IFK4_9HYME|nr:unnamed protein product [Trichogramma brassicae]